MTTARPDGYSATQIALHWVTVLLVFFQLAFGESMGAVRRAIARGQVVDPTDQLLADGHYWIGWIVLGLALLRLWIRFRRGAPDAPEGAPVWTHRAAAATHALFYALLVAMPITGLLAVYVSRAFGDVHELGKPVFIVLILGHIGAVVYHQLVVRDGLIQRMLTPSS